jgi:cytochrome oxidase assembly protein ShyY1
LDRANQKETLVHAYEATPDEAPRDLASVRGSGDLEDFQRVRTRGRFDRSKIIFLDNRTHQGRVGYQVLVPFDPVFGGDRVLVNLGWVPWTGDRRVLPQVEIPEGPVELVGMLKGPPEKVFRLGPDDPAPPGGPWVVQTLEPERLEALLGYAIEPFVVLLDPQRPYGFVREWRPAPYMTPMKHRSYAFQWFALAAAVVLIYFSVNTRRRDQADQPSEAGREQ